MLKVMIIEDEPLIALNLTKILEKKGFETIGHAANFDDAYALFCANKPHIVLSDIKLENGESGIEIIKKLKMISDFCVIYLTSYGDDEIVEEALSTNPFGYITKPFKEIDLHDSLKLASASICCENNNHDFYYNREKQSVFYKNRQNLLTKQETELFHICDWSKGFFVPMHSVECHIWGDEEVSDSTKRGLIHRLRKKLNCNIFKYASGHGCKVDGIV